jgi:hypothetical protein
LPRYEDKLERLLKAEEKRGRTKQCTMMTLIGMLTLETERLTRSVCPTTT